MILTVKKTVMRGTGTAHTAHRSRGLRGWRVTWLPGRPLTREQAVAAMKIAMAAPALRPGMWHRFAEWAEVLDMPPVLARASVMAAQPVPGTGPGDGTASRTGRPRTYGAQRAEEQPCTA